MMDTKEIRERAKEQGLISVIPEPVWQEIEREGQNHANLWCDRNSRDAGALCVKVAIAQAWLDGYLLGIEQANSGRSN